jgi:hypothetical protein
MSDCPTDAAGWTAAATGRLLELRNADGGWPYRFGDPSGTEPTALAVMALSNMPDAAAELAAAADWLVARQRSDGLFAASTMDVGASWVTSPAALALHGQGRAGAAQQAAGALLAEPVFTGNPARAPRANEYDAGSSGWAWTRGDVGFVEPTAMAMIFLKRAGYGAARRVRQGRDMLHTHRLAAGGWNYGEPQVLGVALFPTVAPTAMALLALADEQDDITAIAANWLIAQQGQISSLFSLGWATIALNVLNLLDENWRATVTTRWCELPPERRMPMETALCLLGLAPRDSHPLAVA